MRTEKSSLELMEFQMTSKDFKSLIRLYNYVYSSDNFLAFRCLCYVQGFSNEL
jgi:hypothetical protein